MIDCGTCWLVHCVCCVCVCMWYTEGDKFGVVNLNWFVLGTTLLLGYFAFSGASGGGGAGVRRQEISFQDFYSRLLSKVCYIYVYVCVRARVCVCVCVCVCAGEALPSVLLLRACIARVRALVYVSGRLEAVRVRICVCVSQGQVARLEVVNNSLVRVYVKSDGVMDDFGPSEGTFR